MKIEVDIIKVYKDHYAVKITSKDQEIDDVFELSELRYLIQTLDNAIDT